MVPVVSTGPTGPQGPQGVQGTGTTGPTGPAGPTIISTLAQAEAGTDNTTAMSPLRVEQHMLANALGVDQTWQLVSRSAGVWYQNTTGKPIGAFGRGGIATPVRWRVGPSTSNFIEISMSDSDSNDSADYGWIIVPPNHFYQNIEIWNSATELR
jgi:hypothetical protein